MVSLQLIYPHPRATTGNVANLNYQYFLRATTGRPYGKVNGRPYGKVNGRPYGKVNGRSYGKVNGHSYDRMGTCSYMDKSLLL